jgi:cell division protein FtsI/penicillin-binding protein 2
LNVDDILVKSSNIGMAKIGIRLTNPRLYEAAITFGFGGPTGIELPGELAGLVRPLKKWNSYSTGSVPMGQEIAATPLQIIAGYQALSSDGRMISPHVVLRKSGAGLRSLIVSPTIDPAIADWVRVKALTAVVRRGTGKRADLRGYEVFGKSGTAQKPDPETGAYSNRLHVSSFICGAPADRPRVLVLVSVDEPSVGEEHYGGSVAAPAAAEILKRALMQLQVPSTTVTHQIDDRLLTN